MTISASLVKQLRESSGAGMMDCKKALTETNGDLDAAVDWLRKKGLSAAAKKSGRAAAEGLVSVCISDDQKTGALVEVNAETDFVARNDHFQAFAEKAASLALTTGGDIEALKSQDFGEEGRDVQAQLTHLISVIGENMNLRRTGVLSVENGVVVPYIHNVTKDLMGRIGVVVALESEGDKSALEAVGRQIAMHVAAAKPLALTQEDLDAEVIERERNILIEQSASSGKPREIIEKMIEGRMRKYYEQVVLLEQSFIMDPDQKIKDVIEKASKDAGAPVTLKGYVSYILGDGVEKKEDDFAAEVAAAAGQ